MTVAVSPKDLARCPRWLALLRARLDERSTASRGGLLAGMVAVALLLRLVVVAFVFRSVAAPGVDHGEFGWEMGWVARSLATHQGFSSPFYPATGPTALMPPLYPFLLAGVFRVFGLYTAASAAVILSVNSLLAALTCVPVYFTAARAFDRRTALWAGWLWAAYPFSIYFSAARVWDYALTGLLFACCLWFALRLQHRAPLRLWIAFGLLSALTCLSNPSVTLLFPVYLAIACFRWRHHPASALAGGLAAAFAFVICLAPWTARNYVTFHTLIPVRSGFWLEFEAGNHGETGNSNPPSVHPASNPEAMARYRQQGEALFLDQLRVKSQAYVLAHPGWFLAITARRTVRFWTGFWSLDPVYRSQEPFDLPATFYCTAMLLVMIFGLWQRRRQLTPELALYLALLIIFPIPYYLTHSSPDYRQPIEPELITLVAYGLLCLKRKAQVAYETIPAEAEPAFFAHNFLARPGSKT